MESNATVSRTIQYLGPVPGPVIVWVVNEQGHFVREVVLHPMGRGTYSGHLAARCGLRPDGFPRRERERPSGRSKKWANLSPIMEIEQFDPIPRFDLGRRKPERGGYCDPFSRGSRSRTGSPIGSGIAAGLTGGGGDLQPPGPTNDLIAVYLLDGNAQRRVR